MEAVKNAKKLSQVCKILEVLMPLLSFIDSPYGQTKKSAPAKKTGRELWVSSIRQGTGKMNLAAVTKFLQRFLLDLET